jgi:hypothetical protein
VSASVAEAKSRPEATRAERLLFFNGNHSKHARTLLISQAQV